MADTYTLHIAGLTRELPICKVNDHMDIAAFIMFSDVELTEACAAALLKKAPEFDVILTAEAKGIPLAYEMARQSGKYWICVSLSSSRTSPSRLPVSRRWSSTRRTSSIWTASAS